MYGPENAALLDILFRWWFASREVAGVNAVVHSENDRGEEGHLCPIAKERVKSL